MSADSAWLAKADKAWAAHKRHRISTDEAAQCVMSATVGTGVCLTVDGAYALVRGQVRPSERMAGREDR